jgi:hypothetical protein
MLLLKCRSRHLNTEWVGPRSASNLFSNVPWLIILWLLHPWSAIAAVKGGGASDSFNEKAPKLFHRDYFIHPWDETDHTVDGEDWSLPPWVKAAPYSGIMVPKTVPKDFPGRIQRGVELSWREAEPREGTFDFGALRTAILKASDNGKYSVKMGLEATVWETRYFRKLKDPAIDHISIGSAPRWLTNYGIRIIEERPNSSTPFQVVNLDIYDPEYHKRYLKMVAEFGETGIPQLKALDQCYLHLRSASRGEEGTGPDLNDPNRKLYEERLRAWAAAFKGVEYKLCNVSGKEEDIAYCIRLGMGQRNGFVEHYMTYAPNPMLGQQLDANGYLVADEQNPIIAENRASGDENEEYRNEVRFGPLETFPHRYHESMLRVLQMRRNFLWAEGGSWFVNPPLLNYVALELDKSARTAPDAWCYLRESYVRDKTDKSGKKVQPVKNFERWLFQRDADGARTEPVEKVNIPEQMFEFHKEHMYEYTARKTRAGDGQRLIRFGTDDTFLAGGPHPVAVKITYLDRDNAGWALEYFTTSSQVAQRTVSCGNTGKPRTVTFILKDAWFPGKGYGGQDLQIRAIKGDAIVRLLRVIKLDAKEVGNPVGRP